jgi:molybdopterin-binding protein
MSKGDPVQTIDVEEAAALLHMNPKRVQSLARAGKLPAVRLGRRWLFHRDRIEAMLRGKGSPAMTTAPLSISARNRLRGVVESVRVDGLMAEVVLKIGDQSLVALITRSSAERLGLAPGAEAFAVIKSTEVIVGREGIEA